MQISFFFALSILIIVLSSASQAYTEQFNQAYEASKSGNYKKAVSIWTTLAQQGDVSAQYSLAWLYESGQGVKVDYKKSVFWYQKAANQDHSAAQYALATMYENGIGVKQDHAKALTLFTKAANQGDPTSQFQLGNYYQNGIGTDKNHKLCFSWYQKAASQGHTIAQVKLGNMYESGVGTKQDYNKAIEWYELAAKQNNSLAKYQLAQLYEHQKSNPENIAKAITLYTEAAERSLPQAAYYLGRLYETGKHVTVDIDKAIKWYRRSALQGNVDAQFRLGYLSQYGTNKNIKKAIEWYTQAARREHPAAYYQLGRIYEYGTTEYQSNATPNIPQAFKNYESASALNSPLAHAKLAYFYEKGINTPINIKKAISLYEKSTENWATQRLKKLRKKQHCINTASTRLFTELISCTERKQLREQIKKASIKPISEHDQKWSDFYYTGAAIKGTSELQIEYTRGDLFTRAIYTFIGRDKPTLIVKVKDELVQQYGEPQETKGNVDEGKASFHWILADNIHLNVYRDWPDTTTYVEYLQPDNLTIQVKQQAESMNKQFQPEYELQMEPPKLTTTASSQLY